MKKSKVYRKLRAEMKEWNSFIGVSEDYKKGAIAALEVFEAWFIKQQECYERDNPTPNYAA